MLEFKKVEINDIELYKKFIENTDELSCDATFINLLVWQCSYNNMIAVSDGMLFIKAGSGEKESFRLPIGPDLKKGIELIKEYCGDRSPVFYASEGKSFQKFKESFGDEFEFTELRDNFDYIYNRENLAELGGKKYHSKRNHINNFSKKFNWHYERITAENIPDVKLCAKRWYEEKADKMDRHMICERDGIETILNNMETLCAKGGAIYVNGEVVAFTIGSAISDRVFNTHIEKALSDFSEGYAVINREFAKNELSGYELINREEDMGIEGLRKAKLSYNHEILLKKYIIR